MNLQVSGSDHSGSKSPRGDDVLEASQSLSTGPRQTSLSRHNSKEVTDDVPDMEDANMQESLGADPDELSHGRARSLRKPTVWGRAAVSLPFSFGCYLLGITLGCYLLCIMFISYKFSLHCLN